LRQAVKFPAGQRLYSMDRKDRMPDGATEWFQAQVAPHLPTLFRVAYRLVRNRADAQDLVQDTCVAACENRARVSDADHPVRWLLRVLHNCFIDRTRRHKRANLVSLDAANAAQPLVSSLPGPESAMLHTDAHRAVARAFLQLEPTQRTLLVLRLEGYGLGEIESITGIDRALLGARLHRARNSLARNLEQQTGATCSALLIGSGS
jgi:RNA polymerase sigma-70 factor (ECF subfamily)